MHRTQSERTGFGESGRIRRAAAEAGAPRGAENGETARPRSASPGVCHPGPTWVVSPSGAAVPPPKLFSAVVPLGLGLSPGVFQPWTDIG